MNDEIQPYVLHRIDKGQMECALWRLSEGRVALALFLSEESAESYRESARLEANWRIQQPQKEVLWQLLKACLEAGIGHAVLDPDHEKAKRIFDLRAILRLKDETVETERAPG